MTKYFLKMLMKKLTKQDLVQLRNMLNEADLTHGRHNSFHVGEVVKKVEELVYEGCFYEMTLEKLEDHKIEPVIHRNFDLELTRQDATKYLVLPFQKLD